MEDRNYIMIDGVRCHADRPADCRFCQFWKNRRRGCILGRENCYYLAQVVIAEEERKCEGCRYAVGAPCVSACCYKDLERDLWKLREANGWAIRPSRLTGSCCALQSTKHWPENRQICRPF